MLALTTAAEVNECPEHDFDEFEDTCSNCPAVLGEDVCLATVPGSHNIVEGAYCFLCGVDATDLVGTVTA